MVSSAFAKWVRQEVQNRREQRYLECGGMDYEGTRGAISTFHSVDDDKVTKAFVKERQGCGETGWTSTHNENGGTVRE